MIGLAEVLSPAVANVIEFEVFLAARRLRRHGFEKDDVEQELVLHWLRQGNRYDAHRAAPHTFASHVCRRRAASMASDTTNRKHGAGLVWPVSRLPKVGLNGEVIERPGRISVDTHAMRLGRRSRPAAELLCLAIDVDHVLNGVPAELAEVAHLLATGMPRGEVAQRLGISRATLHRRTTRLRCILRQAGLDKYMGMREAA